MSEGNIGGTPISDLPPSSFAYCEPGDEAVSTRCHFPIRDKNGKADAAHVRNALARLSTSPFGPKARAKVEAAARELGIGQSSKALGELKAEPFTTGKLERWLKGQIPRRILAVPFGGPLPMPNAPRGVDIDGEWFSERTDLFDGHKALLSTRERLVDWHHTASSKSHDPVGGRMDGAILGRMVLDGEPEDDGYWADFWANAGERRLKLVKDLEAMGARLFGSSQAAYKKADPDTGEITVWPLTFHTISTSPQNTFAVVPPLKAVLADPTLEEMPADAVKALLVGYDDLELDLRTASETGSGAAKAGRVLSARNEQSLRTALDELLAVLDQLVKAEQSATPTLQETTS